MKKRFKINFPNEVKIENVDLSRFERLPVILNNHNWSEPLFVGIAENIKVNCKGMFITPIFHKQNESSKRFADMQKNGIIKSVNAGGFYDKQSGNFDLFEVSICP